MILIWFLLSRTLRVWGWDNQLSPNGELGSTFVPLQSYSFCTEKKKKQLSSFACFTASNIVTESCNKWGRERGWSVLPASEPLKKIMFHLELWGRAVGVSTMLAFFSLLWPGTLLPGLASLSPLTNHHNFGKHFIDCQCCATNNLPELRNCAFILHS